MKKINSIITNLILISIFAAIGCVTAMAQRSGAGLDVFSPEGETRPFDFSDKYYDLNGVQPYAILNRVNGQDGKSVFTKNADENHNNVRLIETLPAYNYDGSLLYFNSYGELFDTSFKAGDEGKQAMEIAKSYPMFVFPSATRKGNNRQANLLDAEEGYFTKNPLGLSILVEVEFTDRIEKEDGAQILRDLGARNGYSLDGTPIIKTVREINFLTQMELVTQKVRGIDEPRVPSFAIARAIDTSQIGVIARDAFLVSITKEDGQPLEAENFFIEDFNCLKKSGSVCSSSAGDFQR
ncbi:MAG TPA: hypothetical protein VGC76_13720 [Pyrinomonadaceae bacterium]|jgi:hypothetical protein